MQPHNLRDLQNLTNQILSESTQAEEHFMNSWPYTAPYLSEEAHVEEKELVNEYNRVTAVDRGGETAQIELRRRAQRNAQNKAGARGPEFTHGGPKPLSNSKTIGSSTPRGPEFTRPKNVLRKEDVTFSETEGADLFDVLSEFLVSEGYSEQETLEMMAIMTEEQRGEILDFLESMASANRMRQIRRDGIKTPGSAADYHSRGGSVQHMGRDIKPADKPNPAMSTSKRPSTAADFRRRGGSVQHMGRDITK